MVGAGAEKKIAPSAPPKIHLFGGSPPRLAPIATSAWLGNIGLRSATKPGICFSIVLFIYKTALIGDGGKISFADLQGGGRPAFGMRGREDHMATSLPARGRVLWKCPLMLGRGEMRGGDILMW